MGQTPPQHNVQIPAAVHGEFVPEPGDVHKAVMYSFCSCSLGSPRRSGQHLARASTQHHPTAERGRAQERFFVTTTTTATCPLGRDPGPGPLSSALSTLPSWEFSWGCIRVTALSTSGLGEGCCSLGGGSGSAAGTWVGAPPGDAPLGFGDAPSTPDRGF